MIINAFGSSILSHVTPKIPITELIGINRIKSERREEEEKKLHEELWK